jgi:hypothetical protein
MTFKKLLISSGLVQIAIGLLFIFIIPISNIEMFHLLKEFRVEGQPMVSQFFAVLILFVAMVSLDAAQKPEQYRTFIFWDAIFHLSLFFVWAYSLFVVGIESVIISVVFWLLMIIDPIWGVQALYLLKKEKG